MAKTNVWMSVSDLMTGLMVIFLFVAIAYISRVQKNQSVLTDYVETKNELHNKLVKEFEGDTLKWQMTIGKDLTMKFKEPTVLFSTGSSELTPRFKEILDEFLPRYFNILLNDSLRSNIQEIRIEGHTDDVPMPSKHSDPYIAMLCCLKKEHWLWLSISARCHNLKHIQKNKNNYLNIGLQLTDFLMEKLLIQKEILSFVLENRLIVFIHAV